MKTGGNTMKTIHDMQAHTRRVGADPAQIRPPITLDSVAADIEAIRAEVAACRTLIAQIHEALIFKPMPDPDEEEPVF